MNNNLRERGIYVLPSLFTLANLVCGFFSIVSSTNHKFSNAAVYILFGHLFDFLDGRVARFTKTNSKFGIEVDSLADLVTFGVAPAIMIYLWVLKTDKIWGLPIVTFFIICGALRLARFNIKSHDGGSQKYYYGLPIPIAAGILSVIVMLAEIIAEEKKIRSIKIIMHQIPYMVQIIGIIIFVLSILMISKIKYPAFKDVHILRPKSLKSFVIIIAIIMMIYIYPQNTLFIFYSGYILLGILGFFWRVLKIKKYKQIEVKQVD